MQKIFKKIAKHVVQFIGNRINLFDIYPPYESVQIINEQSIHRYLEIDKEILRNWVIVGGYLGNEVDRILDNYPNSFITIFECSKRYIEALSKRYGKNPRVEIIEMAVTDQVGICTFYETNLKGSGSLLKVGTLSADSFGMKQAEQFSVKATTLDEICRGKDIDVLQIDVQGAEIKVLNGAKEILTRTKAVFTEVSIKPDLYSGSVTFAELNKLLTDNDFNLILLGTDYNLTGNALFIKSKSN